MLLSSATKLWPPQFHQNAVWHTCTEWLSAAQEIEAVGSHFCVADFARMVCEVPKALCDLEGSCIPSDGCFRGLQLLRRIPTPTLTAKVSQQVDTRRNIAFSMRYV